MRPELHLTTDAAEADFAVDLSNVARARELGGDRPADLARFIGLVHALSAFAGDESVQVYAVADWSLLRRRDLLSDEERATLRRWRNRGLIEVHDGADPRLLELADATGIRVVSRDNYFDAYRTYPWIAGSRGRFLRPYLGPDGVAVESRLMEDPPEWKLSRKEEQELLRPAGLYDSKDRAGIRGDLLSRRWRCPEDDCPLFGPQRGDDQPLPVYRGGVVRCPEHRTPLSDVGARPRLVQVKVVVNGVTRHRFRLWPGKEVTVGREPEPPGVALRRWLSSDVGEYVSRRHAVLHWTGDRLTVRDLSMNGTQVRSKDQRSGGKRVRPDRPQQLDRGQAVVLDDGVELVVSGRRFVFEPGPPVVDPTPPPGVASGTTPRKVSDVDK
jgi:FHA domain